MKFGSSFTDTFKQEAQLMLTTGATRLAVSRGQQTWFLNCMVDRFYLNFVMCVQLDIYC